jgi:hypothetical protein
VGGGGRRAGRLVVQLHTVRASLLLRLRWAWGGRKGCVRGSGRGESRAVLVVELYGEGLTAAAAQG